MKVVIDKPKREPRYLVNIPIGKVFTHANAGGYYVKIGLSTNRIIKCFDLENNVIENMDNSAEVIPLEATITIKQSVFP